MTVLRPDPTSISGRADLAAALRTLRENSGATFRELVERADGLHGTVSGWFSGHHVPVKASADMFDRVLRECGVDDPAERELWWQAVGRARSSRSRKNTADRTPPYKGLEPFDTADADWFFGRDDVVETLVARVQSIRDGGGGVVGVVGASGSGKSSVLRAGLASAVPGVQVRTGVADARAFSRNPDNPESVLVFDQIEELWTLATESERRDFLDAVAARLAEGDTVVVFGLRADFYHHAVAEDVLVRGLTDNPIVVGRMGREQLEKVIVEPARKAGATVEDALVRVLVAEMEPRGSVFAHDQGALPMLSHALLTTWLAASGKSGGSSVLTVAEYDETGGLAGAVQQSAEKVFGELTPAGQEEARRIFARLVNIDDDALTRRRVDRVELFRGGTGEGGLGGGGPVGPAGPAGGADADVDAVLESFTASRLLTVEEESVSVTHEVLLTAWDRLRRWIDDDRRWHLTHRRLTDAAVLWDRTGREQSGLLAESRVETLRESVSEEGRTGDLNALEREYLDASARRAELARSQQRRRRRVLEILTGALAVVTVVAVTLAAVAFSARSDADERRVEAEAALAGQLAGSAERLRTLDPGLSVHLALAAYELNPTTAARSALLDASAIHAPVRLPGVTGEAISRFDSTGTLLATAGADGVVRLWSKDGPTMRERGRIELGEPSAAVTLEFAPARAVVAVGGARGTTLWNVENPDAPVRESTIGDVTTTSKSLAFSPDGGSLALVSPQGEVTVWDAGGANPAAPSASPAPSAPVATTAFSPDGRFLVTGGVARSVQVWDTARFEAPVFEVRPDESTYDHLSLAFSPDGRTLAAGTTGREVARWTVDEQGRLSPLPALPGFTSYVNDVAFSASGDLVAAASSDNSVRIWDASTGALRETLPGSTVVMSVSFAPDDSSVVTAGQDGVTRVWPMPGPVMPGQTDTVFINPIDGAGTRLVAGVGTRGDGLRLWDVTDPDRPVPSTRPLSKTTDDPLTGAAAMSWDGTLAAGGTSGGAFQLWDVGDPLAPEAIGEPHSAVNSLVGSLAFTRSGHLLAVSPQNTTDVAIFDVRNPAVPVRVSGFEAGNNPQVMAFSPDGKTLAVPTLGDIVELWDVTDPQSPTPLPSLAGFDGDAQTVAFSPDGRFLVGGSADRTLRIWDVGDPRNAVHVARLVGPQGAVYSAAFDAGGTRLAAGVDGQSMWMWDVSDPWNPKTYATLTAYGTRVNDAVFAAGGVAVVAGGPGKDLRVWRTDPDEVAQRICAGGGMTITEDEWAQYLPGSPYRELC